MSSQDQTIQGTIDALTNRERMLMDAQEGGSVTVRLPIKAAIDDNGNILVQCVRASFALMVDDEIISVEPPPKTVDQQLADALMENNILKAKLAALEAEKSIYPNYKTSLKIEWNGGPCPLHPETPVKVYLRNGRWQPGIAKRLDWSVSLHSERPFDIVAYEVLDRNSYAEAFFDFAGKKLTEGDLDLILGPKARET